MAQQRDQFIAIRDGRLLQRKISRQLANTELGVRVTAKAAPLAMAANSPATGIIFLL